MAKRPKQRLTKLEKIERDIRLAYLKQERSLKAIEKGKRDLMASAKALSRGHAAKRRLETKVANDLVQANTQHAAPSPEPAPKPKRERKAKPKVTETTDIPNSEIFGDPGPIDREAHMVSLGFRKTGKKKRTVAGEVAKILGETLR